MVSGQVNPDYILPWLGEHSIIVEVGAYRGEWVYEVATRYPTSTVHAFEPATLALKFLREKVGGLENVIIHPVGLDTADREATLHNCHRDGASVYATIGESETVQCIDAAQAIDDLAPIDLMHMNAEGAELDILDYLITIGCITKVKRIMLQWHPGNCSGSLKIGQVEKQLLNTHIKQGGYRAWGLYLLRDGNL